MPATDTACWTEEPEKGSSRRAISLPAAWARLMASHTYWSVTKTVRVQKNQRNDPENILSGGGVNAKITKVCK